TRLPVVARTGSLTPTAALPSTGNPPLAPTLGVGAGVAPLRGAEPDNDSAPCRRLRPPRRAGRPACPRGAWERGGEGTGIGEDGISRLTPVPGASYDKPRCPRRLFPSRMPDRSRPLMLRGRSGEGPAGPMVDVVARLRASYRRTLNGSG